MALIAACGGDTIKCFDVSSANFDSCVLQYAPSPGCQVNSVRWNHTNLVLATAGEDRKISLWMSNGRSLGTVPPSNETEDIGDELIYMINFSSKSSRYLCSGGTGKLIRIWDMQHRRCVKWLKGHLATVTGVAYNCRDENLASISTRGELILHNLASGSRLTELKDPHDQVLRILEYSRNSRHLLVTAGDDGSIHLWDTTARIPKVSWVKRHLAPVSGTCFSPSNDKVLVSVGLDKKLYILDSGMKKPVHCIRGEAPFSSLALEDDGCTLAAGTTDGRVEFYDIRGKPQHTRVLHAYSSSEAVTNLSWRRSIPTTVDKENCSEQVALLGGIREDPGFMPDPLPSALLGTRVRIPSTALSERRFGRSLSSCSDRQRGAVLSIEVLTNETPFRETEIEEPSSGKHLWKTRAISQILRKTSTAKDDMEIFSPLADVQPIMPSLSNLSYDDELENKVKVHHSLPDSSVQTNPESIQTPSSDEKIKSEIAKEMYPGFHSKNIFSRSVPSPPFTSDHTMATDGDPSPSKTLPEILAGSISTLTGSTSHGLESAEFSVKDTSEAAANTMPNLTGNGKFFNIPLKDKTGTDKSFQFPSKQSSFQMKSDRRHDFMAGFNSAAQQKIGFERNQDYGKNATNAFDYGLQTVDSCSTSLNPSISAHVNLCSFSQESPSFALQLVQHALEESLGTLQSAIHEDVQNLHLDLIRQSHIQQSQIATLMESVLENQANLMEEVQALRRENQELRRLY